MHIKYLIEKQDYIDFNLYYVSNAANIKRTITLQRFVVPVIFLLLPPFLSQGLVSDLLYWYIWFLGAGILWIIFYPRKYKKRVAKQILRMLAEGKVEGIIGEHDLTITEEGITDRTALNETKYRMVEKVGETNKHLFVYVNALTAYIIPLTAFEDEQEKKEFLKLVDNLKSH